MSRSGGKYPRIKRAFNPNDRSQLPSPILRVYFHLKISFTLLKGSFSHSPSTYIKSKNYTSKVVYHDTSNDQQAGRGAEEALDLSPDAPTAMMKVGNGLTVPKLAVCLVVCLERRNVLIVIVELGTQRLKVDSVRYFYHLCGFQWRIMM